MTDLPKVRTVVDLLRRKFAELRKSPVAEGLREVTPTIKRKVRDKKEASPKQSRQEVQTGAD
jgi:hypothetical protein